MDSLICNPSEVYIAYDYIKQIYKECDDNNLEPKWLKLLDRFVKRLNEVSGSKYLKSIFMDDLKSIQCKSSTSAQAFEDFALEQGKYVYDILAMDIIRRLVSRDEVDTSRVVYIFEKSPSYIASILLQSTKIHDNRTLLELFVESDNISKWEQFGISKETLAKIHNSLKLVRDIKHFLRCVNASILSINPEQYKQRFTQSTQEIISNTQFVGKGNEYAYKKAVMSGFSKYAYKPKDKPAEISDEEWQRQQEELSIQKQQANREKEELKRLKEQKRLLKEEIERQKLADPNYRSGEQHYLMMVGEIIALTEILIEKAKVKRSLSATEGCYLFNELDFLLVKSHSAHTLISVLNSKIDDFYKAPFNGRFSKSQLTRTLEFLRSANKASRANSINSSIQFLVDGKPTPPTAEQVDCAKQYLKSHNIALNETTYTYALRRLVLGGDINSKFEVGCLSTLDENSQTSTLK